ncbi:hypothetical protein H4Q26_012510 [Puccinia striiformis f. sp. tritici PST-130]|nr:hypothetical protein H4Q26_012510 [Puccinia striiformis f. sp. tritici PST-130]
MAKSGQPHELILILLARVGLQCRIPASGEHPLEDVRSSPILRAVPAPTPEGDLLIDTEQNMIEVIAASKKNHVSISLSIGGWTGSRSFSFLVGDQKNRTTFVSTIERAVKKYGLDGIDLGKLPAQFAVVFNVLRADSEISVAQAIKQWTSTGVPAHQLLLGIPSYGYGYTYRATRYT